MTVTRSHLRQALQDTGKFTYREAKEMITILFNILIEELKKGDKLELPFGTLTPKQPNPRRAYQLGKIVRTYTKPKIHFRRKTNV